MQEETLEIVPPVPGLKPNYEEWKALPSWVTTNEFYYKDLINGGQMFKCSPSFANLVSSRAYKDEEGTVWHKPILDLDLPSKYIPSSTPGHGHLYIDKLLPEEQYRKLIDVLVECGILQEGIKIHQMDAEGMTAARLPGLVKKPEEISSSSVPTSTFLDGIDTWPEGGSSISPKPDPMTNAPNTTFNFNGDESNSIHDVQEFATLLEAATNCAVGTGKTVHMHKVVDDYMYFLKKKSELKGPKANIILAEKPKLGIEPF